LVGLHVVLTVKDHPEFVWATFEHVRNAPGLTSQASPPTVLWTAFRALLSMTLASSNPTATRTSGPAMR
jgi:hypothetical protein